MSPGSIIFQDPLGNSSIRSSTHSAKSPSTLFTGCTPTPDADTGLSAEGHLYSRGVGGGPCHGPSPTRTGSTPHCEPLIQRASAREIEKGRFHYVRPKHTVGDLKEPAKEGHRPGLLHHSCPPHGAWEYEDTSQDSPPTTCRPGFGLLFPNLGRSSRRKRNRSRIPICSLAPPHQPRWTV